MRTGVEARDLELASDRVSGVRTDDEVRRRPTWSWWPSTRAGCRHWRRHVRRTMPAIPPVVAHLGITGEVPDLPHEVVLHGDPLLVLRTNGTAPAGAHAWTLLGRGRIAEDMVTALSRHRIDVRDQVEVRVDRSPREQVESWRGSPYGVLWQGRRHGRPPARHRAPGSGRLLRRRARDPGRRAAVGGAVRGAGRPGGGAGVSVAVSPASDA